MNLLNGLNDTWGNALRGDPTNLANAIKTDPAQLMVNTAMVAVPGMKVLSGSMRAGAVAADNAASGAASDAFEADVLANRAPVADPMIAADAGTPSAGMREGERDAGDADAGCPGTGPGGSGHRWRAGKLGTGDRAGAADRRCGEPGCAARRARCPAGGIRCAAGGIADV